LREAKKLDPDYAEASDFWKTIKKAKELKEEAAKIHKDGNIDGSIKKFLESAEVDPLYHHHNS
jgi:hypothetical protein